MGTKRMEGFKMIETEEGEKSWILKKDESFDKIDPCINIDTIAHKGIHIDRSYMDHVWLKLYWNETEIKPTLHPNKNRFILELSRHKEITAESQLTIDLYVNDTLVGTGDLEAEQLLKSTKL